MPWFNKDSTNNIQKTEVILIMAKITQVELVKEIAEETGLTIKDSTAAYKATINAIKKNVIDGNEVAILNFGVFKQAEHKDRMGRNPQTGKPMLIPAHNTPVLRVSEKFKKAVQAKN